MCLVEVCIGIHIQTNNPALLLWSGSTNNYAYCHSFGNISQWYNYFLLITWLRVQIKVLALLEGPNPLFGRMLLYSTRQSVDVIASSSFFV